MLRHFSALMLMAGSAALLHAGEFNKVLNVGDPAPVWKDLEGTDGKKHSLADFHDKDILVVVFTCNSCPVAVDYEDRILAFANTHAGANSRVGLVAINVNTIAEDQLPKMKERATKKKFSFPYLHDPSQKIAKEFGANYTPEFFVLDRERKVAYMGALDDTSNAKAAKENYLEAAVKAILSGKSPPKQETLARGCRIRFNRS